MDFAVMHPAERDGELVTDLPPERPDLGKSQVMRVHGFSPADEAGPGDVGLFAVPPHLGEPQDALVDAAQPRSSRMSVDSLLLAVRKLRGGRGRFGIGGCQRRL